MVIQDIVNIQQEQTRDDLTTWTEADIIQYVNEAVKNIIQRAPQANSKKEFITGAIGVEQELPADAVSIINVIANATVSNKLGDVIHEVDVTMKDTYNPAWRSSRAKTKVVEWMKRSEPTKFLVWPPLASEEQLYVEYSYYPADLTDVANTVVISNEYLEPVRLWCLYRTYGRDSEDTPSVQRAESYRQQFEQFFL